MSDADRQIARKRLKARRDFASTVVTLVVVGVVLVAIWFVTTGGNGYFWPLWPLLGFAIAIVFSGLNAFGVLNRDISDSEIDAEIARMQRRN
jgi:4-hydroxybenzoate polyprenyltransferase